MPPACARRRTTWSRRDHAPSGADARQQSYHPLENIMNKPEKYPQRAADDVVAFSNPVQITGQFSSIPALAGAPQGGLCMAYRRIFGRSRRNGQCRRCCGSAGRPVEAAISVGRPLGGVLPSALRVLPSSRARTPLSAAYGARAMRQATIRVLHRWKMDARPRRAALVVTIFRAAENRNHQQSGDSDRARLQAAPFESHAESAQALSSLPPENKKTAWWRFLFISWRKR